MAYEFGNPRMTPVDDDILSVIVRKGVTVTIIRCPDSAILNKRNHFDVIDTADDDRKIIAISNDHINSLSDSAGDKPYTQGFAVGIAVGQIAEYTLTDILSGRIISE